MWMDLFIPTILDTATPLCSITNIQRLILTLRVIVWSSSVSGLMQTVRMISSTWVRVQSYAQNPLFCTDMDEKYETSARKVPTSGSISSLDYQNYVTALQWLLAALFMLVSSHNNKKDDIAQVCVLFYNSQHSSVGLLLVSLSSYGRIWSMEVTQNNRFPVTFLRVGLIVLTYSSGMTWKH